MIPTFLYFLVLSLVITSVVALTDDHHPLALHKRILKHRRSTSSHPNSNFDSPNQPPDSRSISSSSSTSASDLLSLINTTLATKQSSAELTSPKGAVAAAAGATPFSSSCFPALGFQMPDSLPASLDDWWCDPDEEYAFVGFSYEVTGCQSAAQLQKEFKDIRETYNSRYIRLYGACDRDGFYDDVINAAWDNTLGVHALIWFGFDNTDEWKTRLSTFLSTMRNNPKAPYVTRVLQFGSEPLFDSVLTPSQLADQVLNAKVELATLGVRVTVSELAYGYQKWLKTDNVGVGRVLAEIDWVNAHILPFFAGGASTADKAWPLVKADLDWYAKYAPGKKIYMDENGWPSVSYPGVEPNSRYAVANVKNEQAYYTLLDSQCDYMKSTGTAWFFHLYSDAQEPGYGLYTTAGKNKFVFEPKTSC